MAKIEMTNIEKIRQEIERLYDGEAPKHDQQCEFEDGYFTGIATISKFIDSLPEEKPSEELEEAAKEYMKKARKHLFDDSPIGRADDAFKAGAEWQARQLLKGSPLPEDTVLFQKGVEEGKRLMMEDATRRK